MGFGLFLASLLWGSAQAVHNQSEQRKREVNYQKQVGLGNNLELEKELGVKYYKEMEQTFRDELKKDKLRPQIAFEKMLKIHFPRALNNNAYLGINDIPTIAAAKARLEVWKRGYRITNSVSREYPPTDQVLLRTGWFPYFTRESGAEPVRTYWNCDIDSYPLSDDYPTLEKWLQRYKNQEINNKKE